MKMATPPSPVWLVKCDTCKSTIRTTSDVRESYAGGTCDTCKAKDDDHTLPWFTDLLRQRVNEMGPREKTLNLKFSKAGAKKLLANLERDAPTKEVKTYRNTTWTHRDYECTNLVACQSDTPQGNPWVECDPSILNGLTMLEICGGVKYFGHL